MCYWIFFKQHSELKLIIRPHQLMFPNFINNHIMKKEEVNDLKAFVNSLPNVFFDNELDYYLSFQRADVLIADFSSLIVEFFLTKKPIVYCGEKFEVADDVAFMLPLLYNGKDWNSLHTAIINLSQGKDSSANERSMAVENFWAKNNDKPSKIIVDEILK